MDDLPTPRASPPCPICGKPAEARFRPFCSARCRTIDLGRWIDGRYRIPSDDGPDDEAPAPGET
jgi:endogenous inhibitor of DNA gyrase (YacG/DUF329 family)